MAKLNYFQLVFPKSELTKSSSYQLKIDLLQEIQGNSNAQNQDLIPIIFIEVLDIQTFFEILKKNQDQNQNQNAMSQQKIAMLQEQQQNQIKLQLYNVKIMDRIQNPENNTNQHTTFYRYIIQIFDQMLLLEPKYIRNAIILWSKGEQLRDNVKKNLATFGIKTFENRFNCKKFLIESLKLKFDLSIKKYIIEDLTIKDASDFRIENDRFICRDQNIDLDRIQFSRQIDQFLEIYFSNRRI
ncbi:hypothetical protein PPERSA_11628 [Pseudocohnilembus persalinus]|uniref:Uncharacterized protein n=1 Tax=Pseudocohnilembus persalinus TaxID=266149 RepID=A0A0V0Q9W9_PSEPJ|nr:hypothetical protein PPERSA_11628 [Pseudocohnilembus persalinus]|eukprot:KRW99027.1 hypothetical protein PPERSA_11628 [Pseudocohnilembus persalinus]